MGSRQIEKKIEEEEKNSFSLSAIYIEIKMSKSKFIILFFELNYPIVFLLLKN